MSVECTCRASSKTVDSGSSKKETEIRSKRSEQCENKEPNQRKLDSGKLKNVQQAAVNEI